MNTHTQTLIKENPILPGSKVEYTITVYTENQIGILNRITTIFSRRKISIQNLNSSPSEVPGIHRLNIVLDETEEVVKKLVRQVEKQVDVLKAYYHTNDEIIWQEMALYKVPTDIIAEKAKVERLLHQYGARVVAIRKDFTVFETTGHREETDQLIKALEPFGLIEFVRSARVAIIKESKGFHNKVKEFEKLQPGEEVIENEYLDKQSEIFTM